MKIDIKKLWNNKIVQVLFCLIIALVVYFIIALIVDYKKFTSIDLKSNTNAIFTLTDVSVGNLMYGDSEMVAETTFGIPKKKESFKDGKEKYETYYYDGLELTFKKNGKVYNFMKAIITSNKYYTSRGIRIGDRMSDVINKFFVEDTKGEYMYGNYKEKDLDGKKVQENVYFGHRTKNLVYYIHMDKPYKNGYASLKDNIAQLTMKVRYGKVSKIEVMYGPLE